MNYYNTLDIDNGDKQNLLSIVEKISKNNCCKSLEWHESSTKGYHIKFICNKQCDLCRIVFDDAKRLEHDSVRPEKFKNVLFTEKEPITKEVREMFKNKIKMNCESCEKKGVTTQLTEKTLTYPQTMQKLCDGQIKIPAQYIFGKKVILKAFYLGYTYFECPKCGWFKFVKNSEILKNEA